MDRKPEEYARLLASALCKLHSAESRAASPLVSEDSLRVITETIAIVMADARKIHVQQEFTAVGARRERILLHS